jgi:hypothetical protein
VEALEEALRQRSSELRTLQRHLCPPDLAILGRIAAGQPPLPGGPFEPELWEDGVALRAADVEETLRDLWASLAPSTAADVD